MFRNLAIAGYIWCGFSIAILLSFIAGAYPSARGGAILIMLIMQAINMILGATNAISLYFKGERDRWLSIGFAPSFLISLVLFIACLMGLWAALGGQE